MKSQKVPGRCPFSGLDLAALLFAAITTAGGLTGPNITVTGLTLLLMPSPFKETTDEGAADKADGLPFRETTNDGAPDDEDGLPLRETTDEGAADDAGGLPFIIIVGLHGL